MPCSVDTGTNSSSIFTILQEDTLSNVATVRVGWHCRRASAETPCADSLTQKLSSHLDAFAIGSRTCTVRFTSQSVRRLIRIRVLSVIYFSLYAHVE